MNKTKERLEGLILIGLTARTNNANETNPEKSKIAKLAGEYWSQQIGNQFKHRLNPGVTYSVYTDFESDENGEYTYFVGEVVSTLEDQDLDKFKTVSLPASAYMKFTTNPGSMPDVVIQAWQDIWKMSPSDFDGERSYVADFEVYDKKASDPKNAIVDIYIGLK